MTDTPKLRVQVREDVSAKDRVRVEVLDPEGNVLGDLASVIAYDGVTYKMDSSGMSTLTLSIAVERASIDALEVQGYNVTTHSQGPA